MTSEVKVNLSTADGSSMSEPHFHEEQVVGRPGHVHVPADPPVRTRRVVTRTGPTPFGGNPAAAVLAAVLVVVILILVFGYLV